MDPGQFVSPSVSLLSGETVVLDDLPAGTRISDVKQHLRRRWTHLKEKAIQLSDGVRMLRDTEILQDVGSKLTVVIGEASTCSVEEAMQAINATCREMGKSYSCKVVSWDDVCRSHGPADALSAGGPNITDSRLKARSGQALYTVRSCNWNERLGKVSADDIFVLVPGKEELAPVSLREYLKNIGEYGGYAGLAPDTDLSDLEADDAVSIRFQTTFLPVLEDGSMEFCAEAYNYQTRSEEDPKNLVLLCTSQGAALQQQGAGNQRLFLHDVQADGRISRRWLEAQRTGHRVGGSQEESSEAAAAAAEAAVAAAEAAAEAREAAEAFQEGSESAEALEARRVAEEARAASREAAQEAAERTARAAEAEHAASEGKAIARDFGMAAMGSRCNMLMTIQVPLEQTAPPPSKPYLSLPAPPPPTPGSNCGIDLGATNARVAIFEGSNATVLANGQGNRETPCCIAVKDGQLLVGEAAQESGLPPEEIVFGVKRLLGRKWNSPDLAEDLRHLPFRVVEGKNQAAVIPVRWGEEEKLLYPEEVLALILSELKKVIVEHTGIANTKGIGAVLTVPASFKDAQRQAAKDAGAIAGFNVLRIINEPTAAAIALGLDKDHESERNAVFVDMGGCSTDVTVLNVEDGIFEIKSTAGSARHGGQDLDARLLEYCLAQFCREHPGVDLRARPRALRRLLKECERAKCRLSHDIQTVIEVDSLVEDHDFSCQITRARFEELVREQLEETLRLAKGAMEESGLAKESINEVVLVGGCARIPKLQEMVKEFFGGKEPTVSSQANEDVAKGAAIQAAILCGAGGSAVQDLLLLDVTPLSIGYESANGAMARVIERNTTIPTRRSLVLTTHTDNQRSVKLRIFEGERASSSENNFLSEFVLDGLPPAPRGVPQIKVEFDIDANGILHVSATEGSTGKSNQITVSNDKGKLTQSAIEEMVKAAQSAQLGTAELAAADEKAGYGTANAARVSCGQHEDYWPGLRLREPRRDRKQRCTITVQFYHTVSGGVPSPEDVLAAIDDMESLYRHCEWSGRLAEKGADFAKSTK
eukprot:CAMPEP_0181433530 /NCGR_PEP_ID=MMETSP1110-20121109/19341_1 /TAXON_ID=174948 /ORGANISM="Symbiodinium sp., Strain CCMP421" /LENGTH=1047 /DNA_ID=CAMNT_0023556989 /DNA_START=47 /DNA_END=3190 /DNA_ORIENTATION=+